MRRSNTPVVGLLTVLFFVLAAAGAYAAAPLDPRTGEQWAVAPDAILNLPDAWQISTGKGVTVAIIDSGTNLEHVDLAPNIWTNFKEVPGNGIDDDHNGYVDDVHGIDLTSNKPSNDLSDNTGHGTHVAGIVAAALNGKGVVGVAYNAKIMTVRTVGADGTGTMAGVAAGIRYASANGARIINVSQAGPDEDDGVKAAIEAANQDGSLVVVSAGNDGRSDDTNPVYPAAFAEPNLLTIASTSPDQGRNLSDFSNYGRTTVQLAAPGEDILSTARDGGWEDKSGTSMASPMVAGVAALVAAAEPNLTPTEIRAQLLSSAGRSSLDVGAGYVDALAAVKGVRSALQSPLGQAPDVAILHADGVAGKGTTSLTLVVSVSGATNAIKKYRLKVGKTTVGYVRSTPAPWKAKLSLAGKAIGKSISVTALNAGGKKLASAKAKIRKVAKTKQGLDKGPRSGTT